MRFEFWKYHGNGNDFIVINNIHDSKFKLSIEQIATICDRRYGIGADGLIFLNESADSDFEMVYHNSDGNVASMCGNGGRCVAAFAYSQGIANENMIFDAFDGKHKAKINLKLELESGFDVSLQLADVDLVEDNETYYFLDTGSPHYVEFVEHLAEFNVVEFGRKTRFSERFHPNGTNVNFAELSNERIFVRTYERGVEDETLSCGTGVIASAIAAYFKTGKTKVNIHTPGGDFKVSFKLDNGRFTNLWLEGPAIEVFKGVYQRD